MTASEIEVTAVSNGCSDGQVRKMDRKFFKDMVFQAMYYPGSSITIGNCTLSGTTMFIKRVSQPALKKYYGDLKAAVAYLWIKAKKAKSIVFRSNLENVEYLIQNQ